MPSAGLHEDASAHEAAAVCAGDLHRGDGSETPRDPGVGPSGALPSEGFPVPVPCRVRRVRPSTKSKFGARFRPPQRPREGDWTVEEVTMPNRSTEHSLTLTVEEAAALIGV